MAGPKTCACPKCGSPDVAPLGDDRFRCLKCDTQFRFVYQPPVASASGPIQVLKPTAARSPPRGSVVAAAAIVVALGLAGAAYLLIDAADLDGASTGADGAAVGPALRGVRPGNTQDGIKFWLASYVNAQEIPVARPGADVLFRDADGSVVGKAVGFCEREVLDPGQAFPVLVVSTAAPAHFDAVVQPHPPQRPEQESKQRVLEVLDHRLEGETVKGSVRNPEDTPVVLVELVATGLEPGGDVVQYGTGTLDVRTLKPGEQARFVVQVDGYRVAAPTRWVVYALGRVE